MQRGGKGNRFSGSALTVTQLCWFFDRERQMSWLVVNFVTYEAMSEVCFSKALLLLKTKQIFQNAGFASLNKVLSRVSFLGLFP